MSVHKLLFLSAVFPEFALLGFTTWKVQWYFLPNQNLENNNFSTKLSRNWMLRSEIIGTLFLFSNIQQARYLSIVLPFAWILLSGVFCSNCFPFLRCFVGASDLIRNKTPLSYFNVSENRKIFWFWFILILFAGKTYIISKFRSKYTSKAQGLYVWLHYWEGLSAFCNLHHQQTGRVHVTISGINQLII